MVLLSDVRAANAKLMKARLVTGADPEFAGIDGVQVERVG